MVLAFQGTRFASTNDWANNIGQAFGPNNNWAPYYIDAVNAGDAIAGNVSGGHSQLNNWLIVGHSLGGGLASAAAMVSDAAAITFNAAGLSPHTVPEKNFGTAKITAYHVDYDILTGLQRDTNNTAQVFGQKIPIAKGTPIELKSQFHNYFPLPKLAASVANAFNNAKKLGKNSLATAWNAVWDVVNSSFRTNDLDDYVISVGVECHLMNQVIFGVLNQADPTFDAYGIPAP